MRQNRSQRPTKSVTTVATVPKTPLPSPFPPPSAPSPSFASVAKQGFSWGIGNALAQAAINKMMGLTPALGPAVADPITPPGQNPNPKQVAYTLCVKDFGDADSCKHLLD